MLTYNLMQTFKFPQAPFYVCSSLSKVRNIFQLSKPDAINGDCRILHLFIRSTFPVRYQKYVSVDKWASSKDRLSQLVGLVMVPVFPSSPQLLTGKPLPARENDCYLAKCIFLIWEQNPRRFHPKAWFKHKKRFVLRNWSNI